MITSVDISESIASPMADVLGRVRIRIGCGDKVLLSTSFKVRLVDFGRVPLLLPFLFKSPPVEFSLRLLHPLGNVKG